MVKQGDLIWIDFSPTKGSEQSGRRPAMILSTSSFSNHTNGFAVIAPITDTNNHFPLHVELESGLNIQGFVLN